MINHNLRQILAALEQRRTSYLMNTDILPNLEPANSNVCGRQQQVALRIAAIAHDTTDRAPDR
ncbi:hypothetical protein D9598_20610 [Roseomonas sp. KE0001]|nr:hypothetical protein [Roseomonas sp. KE0001]